jgi:hypothetical protein
MDVWIYNISLMLGQTLWNKGRLKQVHGMVTKCSEANS